ncbi:hypothetical protein E0E05_02665 [Roseitalea porphyridii]|uniref:Uncharacterized protein n=1 Tax=Roseitalea porphyridii TaxID=1852022 RepID=A0A4P6UYN0_9HYPH|nr:hypothetical protein [Roseitalea porphyridii]QBK29593.1 hypothetical protein E0E05_02665 [Roseitalea porphyridii]
MTALRQEPDGLSVEAGEDGAAHCLAPGRDRAIGEVAAGIEHGKAGIDSGAVDDERMIVDNSRIDAAIWTRVLRYALRATQTNSHRTGSGTNSSSARMIVSSAARA